MKRWQASRKIFLSLIFVMMTFVFHSHKVSAQPPPPNPVPVPVPVPSPVPVIVSASIHGVYYEIAPPSTDQPPHSICSNVTFYGEMTITGDPLREFDPVENNVYIKVYEPNGNWFVNSEHEYRRGETITFPFSISLPMVDGGSFGRTHQAISTYPFAVDFTLDLFGMCKGGRCDVGTYLLDPTEFDTPCFDRMTRGVLWFQDFNAWSTPGVLQLTDNRLNSNPDARAVIYPRADGSIEIYGVNASSQGFPAILLTAEEIAALPPKPEENLLIKQFGSIAFYKLTTGEFQVNVGPDVNGNVQVYIFDAATLRQNRRADFNVYTITD